MDTADARHILKPLNGLQTNPYSFFALFVLGNAFDPFYDLIRDIHAGDLVLHILCHTRRF